MNNKNKALKIQKLCLLISMAIFANGYLNCEASTKPSSSYESENANKTSKKSKNHWWKNPFKRKNEEDLTKQINDGQKPDDNFSGKPKDTNKAGTNSPVNTTVKTEEEHSENHKPDVSDALSGDNDKINDQESSNYDLSNDKIEQLENLISLNAEEIPTVAKNESESHSDNNKDGENKEITVEEKEAVNNIESKGSNEGILRETETTQLETSFQDTQDSTNPKIQTVKVEETKSSENSELSEENIIKKISTPEEIVGDIVSMISTPITNVISERLSLDNSIMAANSDINLVASANDRSTTLGNDSDSYEVWSKTHYSYSSNTSRSIHIFGLTLGGEYGFKNNKYKFGLAYTLNGGNGGKYISNSISLYSSINNINIKNFRNNFANIIITYGRLNIDKVKSDTIKDKYSTNLASLNVIFGHNIVLPLNNGIVVPTMGIRYDYINRIAYINNLFDYSDFSTNIITPTIGVSYINKILNDSLTVNVGLNLGYGFNPNKKAGMVLRIADNGHSKTIGYTNSNALSGNLNFGLTYKVRKDIELSLGGNMSYDLGKTFNTGFSFGGKYQF